MKQIGIIGTGRFGMVLESIFKNIIPNAKIKFFSRSQLPDSVRLFTFKEVISCDLIIPAVPIHSFEEVIKNIANQINSHAIIMDVCSVKMYPVQILKKYLAKDITIIASHPLFGPGTIKHRNGDTTDLKWVVSFISGDKDKYKQIVSFLKKAHFKVITMSPDKHDQHMAQSQLISHIMAKILTELPFTKTPVDTKTTELLHEFLTMIQLDKRLLKDIFTYNSYCKEVLEKFMKTSNTINKFLTEV